MSRARPWLQPCQVDRDGRVIVADLNGDGLLVFNFDGSFARVLGAKGSGPGEYRGPIALGVRGDTVAICDAGQDRVIIWRTAGTKLTEWRSPWCSIGRVVMDGRGGVLIPSLLREGRTAHEIWVRRRLDGSGSDTLRPPPDPVPPKEIVPNRRGSSPGVIALPMPVPFQPRTSATFTTSGARGDGTVPDAAPVAGTRADERDRAEVPRFTSRRPGYGSSLSSHPVGPLAAEGGVRFC